MNFNTFSSFKYYSVSHIFILYILVKLFNLNYRKNLLIKKKKLFIYYLINIVRGFLYTNIVTGFSHFFSDIGFNYFENTITANHHKMPSNYNCIKNHILITSVYPIIFISFLMKIHLCNPLLYTFMVFFALITEPVHKYCHRRNHNLAIPKFIKFLQNKKIILYPEFHKKHHQTVGSNYCILSPIGNQFVDYIISLFFKSGFDRQINQKMVLSYKKNGFINIKSFPDLKEIYKTIILLAVNILLLKIFIKL